MLSLISISSFACHLDNVGICGNKAYFTTKNFNPNSIYQFRFFGDTTVIFEFTTNGDVEDSLLTVKIPDGETDVKIQFRNMYTNVSDSYSPWGGNYNEEGAFIELIDEDNSACKLLPVTVSNVQVQKLNNGDINVSFKAGDETDVKEYRILASVDGNTWHTSVQPIPATGASSYTMHISLAAAGTAFAILLPFFGFFNNKKKNMLTYALFATIILVSCKKIADNTATNDVKTSYKFVKVEAISKSGVAPSFSSTTAIH